MRFFKTINTYFIMIFSLLLLAVIFGSTFNNYSDGNSSVLTIKPTTGDSALPANMIIPSFIFPYYSPAQLLVANQCAFK